MSDIWDYSGTASANTSLEGTNVAPGMSPANVDDAIRILTAILRNSLHVNHETFLRDGGALGLAYGGTGAVTAAAALTALGGLESSYRDIKLVSKSAAFTFADADRGKRINYIGAAADATIELDSTVPYTDGAVFVIRNDPASTGVLTIKRATSVSLKVNGAVAVTDAALAVGGVASLIRWGPNDWSITGAGLS
jgi:hypothetical protein